MYTLRFSPHFEREYNKLIYRNSELAKSTKKAFRLLTENPQHPSLRSHKVNSRLGKDDWSSRLTGDLRIIWEYDQNENLVIILLDIGSHSGSRKVYK